MLNIIRDCEVQQEVTIIPTTIDQREKAVIYQSPSPRSPSRKTEPRQAVWQKLALQRSAEREKNIFFSSYFPNSFQYLPMAEPRQKPADLGT